MIITIDGPAGAGKSTVARLLAERLTRKTGQTFEYLDTGSMYRAVAFLGLRNNVDWNDPGVLERLAEKASIDVNEGRTFLDGQDITEAVRTPEVTEKTKFAADNPAIRKIMVSLQRSVADRYEKTGKSVVTEGRDQGTAVFPDSPYKFFVTATPEERARRRQGEMRQRGQTEDAKNLEKILQDIVDRDHRDSSRAVGPLRKPDDAVEIITDDMNIDTVTDRLLQIVLAKKQF